MEMENLDELKIYKSFHHTDDLFRWFCQIKYPINQLTCDDSDEFY